MADQVERAAQEEQAERRALDPGSPTMRITPRELAVPAIGVNGMRTERQVVTTSHHRPVDPGQQTAPTSTLMVVCSFIH